MASLLAGVGQLSQMAKLWVTGHQQKYAIQLEIFNMSCIVDRQSV